MSIQKQQMRASRVLTKLRAGEIVNCFKSNLSDARAVEIAALQGIDMLFFGPADFSHGIGVPGVWDDPRLVDARRRVAAAAAAHGKFAGTVAGAANLDSLIAMGYQFLCMGADVVGLSQYCAGIMSEFTKRPVEAAQGIYSAK